MLFIIYYIYLFIRTKCTLSLRHKTLVKDRYIVLCFLFLIFLFSKPFFIIFIDGNFYKHILLGFSRVKTLRILTTIWLWDCYLNYNSSISLIMEYHHLFDNNLYVIYISLGQYVCAQYIKYTYKFTYD